LEPQVAEAWIVNGDYLAKNRKTVVGALRAMAKATLFAQTNPDAALDILRKTSPEGTQTDYADTWMKLAVEYLTAPSGEPYGEMDPAAWAELVKGMLIPGADSGLTKQIDVNSLVDNSLIQEVNDFDHEAVIKQAQDYSG
jgi:NitT/TauT family transport system substrate-binding protein